MIGPGPPKPASLLGPVSVHVRDRLAKLLDERRVVVWFDAECAFAGLVGKLDLAGCVVISAGDSRLRARREAEAVYRQINRDGADPAARRDLLIYVPASRAARPEERLADPFEGFACCGGVFGDLDGEKLLYLAQAALPERRDEIERLFRDGAPTLDLLDSLPTGARYPLVRQALGKDSPVEAIAGALSDADSAERLDQVPGALAELARMAQAHLGFSPRPGEPWPALRDRLATFLLVSELAFDLPGGLPSMLGPVPHAEAARRQAIFDTCDRWRETDAGREAYLKLAGKVEPDLRVAAALGPSPGLGTRDTFLCQERVRLRAVVRAGKAGDLAVARAYVMAADRSVWRREAERSIRWRAAQRCLAFLELAATLEAPPIPTRLADLVAAYVLPNGLWRLDQAQRLAEQASAGCADDGKVGLYRLEVTLTAGTGKLRTPAGLERGLKESLNRAWTTLLAAKDRQGLTPVLAQKDIVAEAQST